jgi:hypothetical protein
MRTRSRSSFAPVHRISGPVELLEAVPYLLGFHPHRSLVLVGLHDNRLVVTGRLDLADADHPGVVESTVAAFERGGATSVIAVAYDHAAPAPGDPAQRARWRELAHRVRREIEAVGCELGDALLVAGGRWWSLTCDIPACCPPEGQLLDEPASAFAAQATFEGMVALPDRASLEALFEPAPDDERERLEPDIAEEERAAVRAVLEGKHPRRERGIKRALFAAARASDQPGAARLRDVEVVRYGVALSATSFRDALWLAVDAHRLDGRPLWRELARRLPAPYDAAPLFLHGWASWRAGDGTQAGMAAERAVQSDPAYTAADLLMAAVTSGLSPHGVPRLRRPA